MSFKTLLQIFLSKQIIRGSSLLCMLCLGSPFCIQSEYSHSLLAAQKLKRPYINLRVFEQRAQVYTNWHNLLEAYVQAWSGQSLRKHGTHKIMRGCFFCEILWKELPDDCFHRLVVSLYFHLYLHILYQLEEPRAQDK